jgi:conjugative transfer region protein TrbK
MPEGSIVMDGRTLAQLGAVAFVAIAISATAIDLTRKEETPTPRPALVVAPSRDPLREDQRRCQLLGQAAAGEAACLRVWAETRDRFLGRTHSFAAAQPGEGR